MNSKSIIQIIIGRLSNGGKFTEDIMVIYNKNFKYLRWIAVVNKQAALLHFLVN